MTDQRATSYVFRGPGEGTNYAWENDHTFVKVAAGETGGAYTLMEDNLKPGFSLGLHRHNHSAETFYILEGAVTYYLDGDWRVAEAGTTVHVPAGVPHAVRASGQPAKMLMIMQPAGFDLFLAEMATFTEADFADPAKLDALSRKYDIENLGPVPPHPDDP